jgi:hypothetical protein
MADRSSTRALTTEDDLFDSDSDVNVNSDGSEDDAIETAHAAVPVPTIETAHAAVPVPTPNSAKHALPSPSPTASKKSCSSSLSSRPTSVRKPKAQQSGVGQNQSDLIGLKHEQLTYEKQYRQMEMNFRDREVLLREEEITMNAKLRDREILVREEEMATNAKLRDREILVREEEMNMNAKLIQANVNKVNQETALAVMNMKVTQLLKRKELMDAGVSQEEIDIVLPLHYH